jgi:hypothetical protein
MKSKRYILAAGAIAVVCLATARLAISIPSRDKTYEVVETQVATPEYRTDAARAIDAYERLMERYMDLAEGQLLRGGADCQSVMDKLVSLDSRLNELSARLARIEKALGIDPNSEKAGAKTQKRDS